MNASFRRFFVLCALCLTPGAGAYAAEQVELHLMSGQTITGELESEDAEQVVVKSTMVTKSGKPMSMSTGYKRVDIKDLVRQGDPEVTYANRSGTAKTAAEHAALAAWCRDQGMLDRAAEQAQAALAIEPDHAPSIKLLGDLGWVHEDGKWMKESDWLAAHGQVRFHGKIVTLAEAEQMKAQLKADQARTDAQQLVDDKTHALAALDRRIEDLPKRPGEIDAEIQKTTTQITEAKSLALQVTTTKTAFDTAQQRLAQAQAAGARSNPGTAGNSAPAQTNLQPLQQAVEDAQKAYNAARRSGSTADQTVTRLQAHITALKDEKSGLEKKGIELKASRETLVKELAAAKATLAALPALGTPPVPAAP